MYMYTVQYEDTSGYGLNALSNKLEYTGNIEGTRHHVRLEGIVYII